MRVRVRRSVVRGIVEAPPSKSWAIRLILLASIADGESEILNVPEADDVKAALNMAKALGASIEYSNGVVRVRPMISNCGGYAYLGGSGTTLRIGLALASLCRNPITIDGDDTLRSRPIEDLVKALRALGASVAGDRLPLTVRGPVRGGLVEIRGDVTSQYVSGLMFLGSMVGLKIIVKGRLVSRQYPELTARILNEHGCLVEPIEGGYVVNPCRPRPVNRHVPGDYALSAFYSTSALATGGWVKVTNLPAPMGLGDDSIVDILGMMGAKSTYTDGSWIVEPGDSLKGIEVDLADAPDLAPVVASIAPFTQGVSKVTGVEHLAYKESNRLLTIVDTLRAFGVDASYQGGIVIKGSSTHGAYVKCPNDHRIAMMAGVLGLASIGETIIDDAECVSKSNPQYWASLKALGGYVEVV